MWSSDRVSLETGQPFLCWPASVVLVCVQCCVRPARASGVPAERVEVALRSGMLVCLSLMTSHLHYRDLMAKAYWFYFC